MAWIEARSPTIFWTFGPTAELDVAVGILHLLAEPGQDRDLAARHPVPLLLELGAGVRREQPVAGRVDGRDVDRVVLQADLGQRERLDRRDPAEPLDLLDHVGAEGVPVEDQQVGADQGVLARPRRGYGVLRVDRSLR